MNNIGVVLLSLNFFFEILIHNLLNRFLLDQSSAQLVITIKNKFI